MSLVLIMGLPAAGKTSLCQKILENRPDTVIFSLDEINGRWTGGDDLHGERKTFERTVRRHLEQLGDEQLDNRLFLVDDNFYLRSMRRPFERMARSFRLRYSCVLVDVDVDEALRRNSSRGADRVHDETILRMAREMEVPEGVLRSNGEEVERILERLGGTRPRRPKPDEISPNLASPSPLAELDSFLRGAVSEAVREGLDGRRLALAKKRILNRCRQQNTFLTETDVKKELTEEYLRLEPGER
ncbi:hypothetical protein Q1695_004907 [Nippostrongylus brasiliensis]|nr:hypothetical protein Q1695_004907 [Nippostrongylus brasiliensis]